MQAKRVTKLIHREVHFNTVKFFKPVTHEFYESTGQTVTRVDASSRKFNLRTDLFWAAKRTGINLVASARKFAKIHLKYYEVQFSI